MNDDLILEVRHLCKRYDDIMPLRDISCQIRSGEVISIIGPSGTGKSTFLRCLNRLETPDGGDILYHGKNLMDSDADLTKIRRRIGMVFQSFNLFSNMDVLENIVMAPIMLNGKSRQEAEASAQVLLEAVGVAEKKYAWPDELSGGQKQRVAIARALAMEPEVLLFDEPTSALDPTMVDEVNSVIRSLADEGMTMLIVTHDLDFARSVSTRVFFLNDGEIYEEGTPETIFNAPVREETRQFILKQKTLELRAENPSFDFASAQGRLIQFCRERFMGASAAVGLQHIFEEVVMENLLPRTEVFPIRIQTRCRDDGKNPVIIFHYGGDEWNPMENKDRDSIQIALEYSQAVSFSRRTGGNHLEIRVKEA